MNMKPIVAVAIALTVGIVTFSGVLIPAIENGVTTEDTYTNTGIFNAKSINETSNHTLSYDYTNPSVLTVDDESVDMTNTPQTYGSVTVLFSNDWFLRYVLSNNSLILYKCGTNSAAAIKTIDPTSESNVSVTISEGTATIVMGESTYTYTVDGAGMTISSDKGDYVIKTSTTKAYVNGDSVVYGIGRTERALGTGGTSFNAMISATVDDGLSPIYYSPEYNFSENESVNYTENSSHKDLYELSGFTFNLVSQGVDHPITYNQIFVPTEVTAERTVHANTSTILLFQTIPVFIVLGMIVAVVGVLYLKSRR